MDDKNMSTEQIEVANEKHQKLPTGTVHLIEDGSIILVPTPTSDPNGKAPKFLLTYSLSDLELKRPFEYANMAKIHHSHCCWVVRRFRQPHDEWNLRNSSSHQGFLR